MVFLEINNFSHYNLRCFNLCMQKENWISLMYFVIHVDFHVTPNDSTFCTLVRFV